MKSIDVCIVTYRRPKLLQALLQTLITQSIAGEVALRVIIVDNDIKKSAQSTVEAIKATFPFPIVYEVEPKKGITFARNRALTFVNAKYFAFLDDDETVNQNWLSSLLKTMHDYDADVVFGSVKSILPDNAPNWARNHPCFQRPIKGTGKRVLSGGCGNVLVRTEAIGNGRMRFNDAYALTGGEDTDYFYRLYLEGRTMVWCEEALAYEHVPDERLTTQWVYRRAYRGGECYARVFASSESLLKKVIRITKNSTRLVLGCMVLPLVYMVSNQHYVRLRTWIYSASGQLNVLLGGSCFYQEYGHPTYKVERSTVKRFEESD